MRSAEPGRYVSRYSAATLVVLVLSAGCADRIDPGELPQGGIDGAASTVAPPPPTAGRVPVLYEPLNRAPDPSESVAQTAISEDEREAIRQATIAYVRRETLIRQVSIEIVIIADGWARVRVVPEGEVTDPATLYLRKDGDVWNGVVLGTGFTPDDLDRIGAPESIRPSSM